MDEEFPEWTFRFRVVTKGGGKGKARGEEGLRALSRSELEKVLAAGNRARAWRAEARERRWAVVQERRRRQLAEERAAEAQERAAKAQEEADKYHGRVMEWVRAHWEEAGRRVAAEAEVARLRAAATAATIAEGPIRID